MNNERLFFSFESGEVNTDLGSKSSRPNLLNREPAIVPKYALYPLFLLGGVGVFSCIALAFGSVDVVMGMSGRSVTQFDGPAIARMLVTSLLGTLNLLAYHWISIGANKGRVLLAAVGLLLTYAGYSAFPPLDVRLVAGTLVLALYLPPVIFLFTKWGTFTKMNRTDGMEYGRELDRIYQHFWNCLFRMHSERKILPPQDTVTFLTKVIECQLKRVEDLIDDSQYDAQMRRIEEDLRARMQGKESIRDAPPF